MRCFVMFVSAVCVLFLLKMNKLLQFVSPVFHALRQESLGDEEKNGLRPFQRKPLRKINTKKSKTEAQS